MRLSTLNTRSISQSVNPSPFPPTRGLDFTQLSHLYYSHIPPSITFTRTCTTIALFFFAIFLPILLNPYHASRSNVYVRIAIPPLSD